MLDYEVIGDPSKPAMVLVHGFLSSRIQWERNVERLTSQLQLVIVELPGHGQSPSPDQPAAYELDAIVPQLDAIRNEIDRESWWVCGQSLGAAISLHYVLRHQDDVDGVIITNSRAAFGRTAPPEDPVDYSTVDRRELPFHPAHARRFPNGLRDRMAEGADSMPAHVLTHIIGNRSQWRCVERLGELRVPTLLVNGRYERVFQPLIDDARFYLPSLEVTHLPGGHSINVEQPEAFDAAVLDFVSRHG